jgi:hypothetical protein
MAQTEPRTDNLFRGDAAAPEKSAGQLVKEVSEDISTLVRKEIELAKQEVGASITAKATGVGILIAVGALGFFMLIFALLAVRDGFDRLWVTWIADLATMGVIAIFGAIGLLVAKKKLSTPLSAELTKKNVKEDVELMKSLGKR